MRPLTFSSGSFGHICVIKQQIMSRELLEFSDLIDKVFDPAAAEADDFWEQVCNLFV